MPGRALMEQSRWRPAQMSSSHSLDPQPELAHCNLDEFPPRREKSLASQSHLEFPCNNKMAESDGGGYYSVSHFLQQHVCSRSKQMRSFWRPEEHYA